MTDAAPRACPCCTRQLFAHELDLVICGACLRSMSGWMREIPHQMTVLRGSRQRESSGGPRVAGSRTAPLPGDPRVLNLIGPGAPGDIHDEHGDQHGPLPIVTTLGTWCRVVAEERHLDGPRVDGPEALAAWLEPHLGWAIGQQWAPEMYGELRDMMGAIRGITRVRPQRRAVPQPCPRCDELTLSEVDWQTYVECGECSSLFTAADLALAARVALAVRESEAAV